jgi:hypothetical protein
MERLGPGQGDHATKAYMKELGEMATDEFKEDFSEQCISGNNGLRVDFYFPGEKTVVEVAMGLRNSNSEFERDILKVLMAGEGSVKRLVFLTKPSGIARTNCPSARAILRRCPLSGDGVTQGDGDIAAIRFILAHFKDDLIHGRGIACGPPLGKPQIARPCRERKRRCETSAIGARARSPVCQCRDLCSVRSILLFGSPWVLRTKHI